VTSDVEAPAALSERRGNVLIITLNRPEARNAVNSAVSAAVGNALQDAQDDPEVRAVVITGAGESFCAGADLKAISRQENLFHPDHDEWGFAGYVHHYIDANNRRERHCAGGGVGARRAITVNRRWRWASVANVDDVVIVATSPGYRTMREIGTLIRPRWRWPLAFAEKRQPVWKAK
jgi:enoyl-CoA hydratase/carnithine racemase